MGSFTNNAITADGRLLLADVQAGATFIPTRIVMGSGSLPTGASPATMTAVITPVVELALNKINKTPDGKCIIGGVFSNADIATAFYFRELALFARAEYREPDGTVKQSVGEVLYSYGNAGNNADYLPAYSTNTAVEKQIDLVVWIGNSTAVSLEIASGIYITTDNMDMLLEEYAKKLWVTEYIDMRQENVVIPLIGDMELLSQRMDEMDARLSGVEAGLSDANEEIDALKAADVEIRATVNEAAARASAVWDALFTDITENPAIVDFDTLEGITLSGGVWNEPLRRLEV